MLYRNMVRKMLKCKIKDLMTSHLGTLLACRFFPSFFPVDGYRKLGVEDGRIKEGQLSASTHDGRSPRGRLNQVGGWVPVLDDDKPFYCVDLLESTIVSGIIIQGYECVGKQPSNTWVTKFRVECKAEDGVWQNCGVRKFYH